MQTGELFSKAMKEGNVQEYRRIMQNHAGELRGTPVDWFYEAAAAGSTPIVQLHLEMGVDVNAGGSSLTGAVVCAAEYGHLETVRKLLDCGALLNDTVLNKTSHFARTKENTREGKTACWALESAILGKHLDVVKLLVERGADVNAYWKKMTPLLCAEQQREPEIAEYLRTVGAKLPHELQPWDLPAGRPG